MLEIRIAIAIYYLALVTEHSITHTLPEKHRKYWVLGSSSETKCYLEGQI